MKTGRTKLKGILFICLGGFFILAGLASFSSLNRMVTKQIDDYAEALLFIVVGIVSLNFGRRILKQVKSDLSGNSHDLIEIGTVESSSIYIKVKVSKKEYVNLLLTRAYTRTILVLPFAAGLTVVISYLLQAIGLKVFDDPVELWKFFVGLFFASSPLFLYFQISKNYNSTNYLKEPISYLFSIDGIVIEGESFYNRMKWDFIRKWEEHQKHFLLFTSASIAIIIPKRSFTAIDELNKFKTLVRKNIN